MITLEELKTAVRITSNKLNDEVQDTMDAALLDLATAGVKSVDDALIDLAIKLYARWYFDYCSEGERYQKAYTDLKSALALTPEYNGGTAQ